MLMPDRSPFARRGRPRRDRTPASVRPRRGDGCQVKTLTPPGPTSSPTMINTRPYATAPRTRATIPEITRMTAMSQSTNAIEQPPCRPAPSRCGTVIVPRVARAPNRADRRAKLRPEAVAQSVGVIESEAVAPFFHPANGRSEQVLADGRLLAVKLRLVWLVEKAVVLCRPVAKAKPAARRRICRGTSRREGSMLVRNVVGNKIQHQPQASASASSDELLPGCFPAQDRFDSEEIADRVAVVGR